MHLTDCQERNLESVGIKNIKLYENFYQLVRK